MRIGAVVAVVALWAAGCGSVSMGPDGGVEVNVRGPSDARLDSGGRMDADASTPTEAADANAGIDLGSGTDGVEARIDTPPPRPDAVDTLPPRPDAAAPRCNPSSPFRTPTPLTSINTADSSEEGAYLSPDELTLYFGSTRPGTLGGYDLFLATRARQDAMFANVMPVTGVNTSASERRAVLSGDGLYLYSTTGTTPNYQISVAQRATSAGAFGPLAVAAAVNSTSNDEITAVIPDHRALYLHSNRGGNYDIYRAPRVNNQLGTPLPVTGLTLNTASSEHTAAVTPDELTLLFSSDRAGGVGATDIYLTTRASTADGFGMPVNVQAVNSTSADSPSWISADGCVLYLTRGSTGAYDILVSFRGM
jgi:Tol biopolymer transport system component